MNPPETHELMRRLTCDADRICAQFQIRYKEIAAERANVRSRYGVCYSDGTIKIRLRHAATGRPLKYSSLVSTLCHELAHLRHFDHGAQFQALYARVLAWARKEGIYRPGPGDPQEQPAAEVARREPLASSNSGRRPLQLELFSNQAGFDSQAGRKGA